MLLAVEDANSGQAVYVAVSVGVGVDAYVDVGVDGNLVCTELPIDFFEGSVM